MMDSFLLNYLKLKFKLMLEVKHIIVVTKKSRGIGYVKFTDSNDAAKAMKSVKLVEGRKVFISFANSKSQTESKKSDESTTISGYLLFMLFDSLTLFIT